MLTGTLLPPHPTMGETNGHATAPLAPQTDGKVTPLQSFPGPLVHGKATSVTLFNRAQLIASGLLPPLETLINQSFNASHASSGILSARPRLRYAGQFMEELGEHPDTFVYIVRTADADEMVATAYASRYEGVTAWPEGPGERTWQRLGIPGDGVQAWELHMLAVSPSFQRHGLADYLMGLVDGEVGRRAAGPGRRLVLFISTVKETNERFYAKRGFGESYCVKWPVGHFGSERAFTVTHMEREIRAERRRM